MSSKVRRPAEENRSRKLLSEEDIAAIRSHIETSFSLEVGALLNRKIDDLLPRQSPAVCVTERELQLFSVEYLGAVRRAAGNMAKELAQAVGTRRGLGKRELDWIEGQTRNFLNSKTAPKVARRLFYECYGNFTVTESEKAADELVVCVAVGRDHPRLMKDATEGLALAKALYGKRRFAAVRQAKGPTPGEKVADPVHHPVLTVIETAKLFGKSRSTIYRWLEEGKLMRAGLAKRPDKRISCLILTESAKKLLEEGSE